MMFSIHPCVSFAPGIEHVTAAAAGELDLLVAVDAEARPRSGTTGFPR